MSNKAFLFNNHSAIRGCPYPLSRLLETFIAPPQLPVNLFFAQLNPFIILHLERSLYDSNFVCLHP